jgi:hypothetical protein
VPDNSSSGDDTSHLLVRYLEHFPPQLNRGILVRRRIGESIGIDSFLGGWPERKQLLQMLAGIHRIDRQKPSFKR